jgi:sugar lactone lactonase YvrE
VGPKGIVIAQDGKVVVASRDRAAQEIFYGTPQIASVSPARIGNRGGQKITVKGTNFSSDTSLMVAATVISDRVIVDTQTITFTAPVLPSGRHTLAVRNRGGYGQVSFTVDSVPLSQLPAGYITTVAGGSTYAGEGTAATDAPIGPLGMAVDTNGNVFVADGVNQKVRRIDGRSGVITTVAGNGNSDGAGDDVPAVTAALSSLNGVAFDPAGNLLISAGGIRKVDAATGIISTTIRGDYGFCGDGGKALDACFNYITGFAIDARGNVFIADRYNARIRRVDAITQIITTIAGNGETGFSGDGGAAKAAALNSPFGVAVDDARKLLYIADAGNNRVRQVDLSTNIITTVAGGGSLSNGIGDNQRATTAVLSFPTSLAIDAAGNLLIADRGNGRIRKLELATGIITTVAGSDGANSTGDGGPATAASIQDPFGVAIDGAGNILIAEYYACVVRRVDSATGIITTLAGNRQCAVVDDNVQATATTLRYPVGVTIDAAGNLFITDSDNDRIRRVDAATGIITTIAGGGHPETGIGDGGPAKNAVLSIPRGRVALDADGNLYIADRYNYRVRKVDLRTNIITTVAGNGQLESSGDGMLATAAGVLPDDLALDRNGNLYIAENDSHRIRKVNLFTGIITSVAAGTLGSEFRIAVDSADNLFIADTESRRILRVEGLGVRTVAGGGSLYPENQPAPAVSLLPIAIDIDAAGNIFIVDYSYPYGIRKISVETGLITGVAGTNPRASLGDNGPAIAASLYYPLAVSVDARGNLFIADSNQRIRAVRGPIP